MTSARHDPDDAAPRGARGRDDAGRPTGIRGILRPRTLANSHPGLLALLLPGRSVLDVGPGQGLLTAEIAERVRPGRVVGLDASREMVEMAAERHPPAVHPNLVFTLGDIRDAPWERVFDVVNAARTLGWIPDVEAALSRMARAVHPQGHVVALDVDHARTAWLRPPRAWSRFFAAFLEWRAAIGLDNELGTHLPAALRAVGLAQVQAIPQVTTVRATDPDFYRLAGAWRMMAESRGRQMVHAGALSEQARREALAAFSAWMREAGAAQTTQEVCAIGTPEGGGAPLPDVPKQIAPAKPALEHGRPLARGHERA